MVQSKDSIDHLFRFRWGQKRGVGGSKRNIQFYESFMIDDVNYSLYDCVYLYAVDVHEPYIGKIIKIWELPDHTKKVKILWFFRPNELKKYLVDIPLKNEIFLASGEGVGLFNINPLEAIAGKCSVVCTSKDERNRQSSNEELDMADYVFYRTFDVGSYKISGKIDDKIAGVEAKFLLNRKDLPYISNFEENGECNKASPSTSTPSHISMLGPLRNLESKDDRTIAAAPNSLKRDDSADFREDSLNYGKKRSNLSLSDNESSIKMRRIDTSAEASYNAGLRKQESNGRDDPVHLLKKASEKNDILPPDKRSIETPTETLKDDSSRRQKLKISEDGSSKETFHLHKEYTEKNDMVVDNKIFKKKPIGVQTDALNVSGSRKQQYESNGDNSSKEIVCLRKELPERRNLVEKKIRPLDVLLKATSISAGKTSGNYEVSPVIRRPDEDRRRWFKDLPWEDRLQKADGNGTLVFIENLDPSYTSLEIEDIIYSTFKKSCTAKVIQRATFENPNYGEAYLIFKSREAADEVVSEIDKGCLQLPNGRILVCTKGLLKVPKSSIFGHLSIDKLKVQTREMSMVVSTSHCSQPNTIEYEMAMEWLLVQQKSIRSFNALHKRQAGELKELTKRLNTK